MSLIFSSKKLLAAALASAAISSAVFAADPAATAAPATAAAMKGTTADGAPKPPEFKPAMAPAAATVPPGFKPAGAEATPSGPAALHFDYMATKIDLKEGEIGHLEFPVENQSDKTITISAVRPSCGCTTATDNPASLKPGEKSKIKVDFNSTGRTGANHKTVTVETSDTNHPSYVLSFEATVTTDVFLSSQYLSFGVIDEGKEAIREFSLTSMTDPPVKIISVKAEDPRIAVKQGATEPVDQDGKKGQKTNFTVTVPADFKDQQLNSRVTITTDYAKNPSMWMTVEARFEGDIVATPNRFYADVMADSDTTRTVPVTLKSRTGREFTVTGVEQTVKPPFKTTIHNGKLPGTQEVILSVTPKEVKTTESGRAKILIEYKDTKEKKALDLTLLVTLRQRPTNPLGHGIQVKDYKGDAATVNGAAQPGATAAPMTRVMRPQGTPLATIAVPPHMKAMTPAAATAPATATPTATPAK